MEMYVFFAEQHIFLLSSPGRSISLQDGRKCLEQLWGLTKDMSHPARLVLEIKLPRTFYAIF